MKLEPPYKQYEGMWLSGTPDGPVYFIAKFLKSETPSGYSRSVIEFLVVGVDGVNKLSWFSEPSFLHELKTREKYQSVIKYIFEGKNET